jgi:succinate dehydrogenase/fumarate reductase cytochrome b subunit
LRRLHSAFGVGPLAVFMLVQLWTHAKALDGPEAYGRALGGFWAAPAGAVWYLLVIAPLAYHAGYGLWRAGRARYTVARYPHAGNWNYTLQRLSGVATLLFVGACLWRLWLPLQLGRSQPRELYDSLSQTLSTTHAGVPLVALAVTLGLAAVCFHLAVGVWSFAFRWGWVTSRQARLRCGVLAAALGFACFGYGARTLMYFATGMRIAPSGDVAAGQACSDTGPLVAPSANRDGQLKPQKPVFRSTSAAVAPKAPPASTAAPAPPDGGAP